MYDNAGSSIFNRKAVKSRSVSPRLKVDRDVDKEKQLLSSFFLFVTTKHFLMHACLFKYETWEKQAVFGLNF